MTSAIKITQVSKHFGNNTILNNISFKIPQGQIVALLGKNGAGKTTLINIILDLLPKDSGTITINDRPSKKAKDQIGVMPQFDISLTRIRVKEVIHLAQCFYQHPLSFEQIIAVAKLEQQQDNFLNQLSGGQKRRLSFALALAGDPKILFLDEPSNGMDPLSRQEFWQEVLRLKQAGKTIFVTNHHLDELEDVADRILFLQDHQIVFDGSLQELHQARDYSTIIFDSSLDRKIFETISGVEQVQQFGHQFTLKTNEVNIVVGQLSPLLQDIHNLHITQTSLENIFIEMEKKAEAAK